MPESNSFLRNRSTMGRSVRAVIDTDALRHNLGRVRHYAPGCRVMAVIKANAYGHDMIQVAMALTDADAFAVISADEAVYLREIGGINKPIVVIDGFFRQEEIPLFLKYKLTPVLNAGHQIEWLRQWEKQHVEDPMAQPLFEKVWIKLDTGMHRLGFLPQEVDTVVSALAGLGCIGCSPDFFSHFACADEPEHPANLEQLTQFEQLTGKYYSEQGCERSMANSAALISNNSARYDWVRPGIMLYGASPLAGVTAEELGLKPVMTLSSELIAVKRLRKNDCVGYGHTWCCPQDMDVGVVAVGYGDGYPRHVKPGTSVLLHGREVPIVGRVSMDTIVIDLRTLHQHGISPAVGDEVILWGQGLPADIVAEKAGTISYELFCQVTNRVSFHYS